VLLDFDVVVVGAGPAGAVSAQFAAKKGARTLIIDRKRDIGAPVRCAEAVAGALPANFGVKNSSEWLMNQVHNFKIISPKGRVAEIKTTPYVGYILDRAAFEKELLQMAIKSGAELELGKTVTNVSDKGVMMGNEIIKTRIVIAADGVDSKIGRLAGLNTKSKTGMLGSCAQHTLVNIDLDSDSLEFYFGSKHAPGGYAWVFPKNQHEANVGVGILRPSRQGVLGILDNFIKTKFQNAQSIRLVSGCVPSALPPKECVRRNVLLVGDAARQVNPFTGAGIANAFIAGKIAGEVSGDVIGKNLPLDALKKYDEQWRGALGKKLIKGLKLRRRVMENDKNIERFCLFLNIIPQFILKRYIRKLHY
jgi:digeranylgeranylglycerophospholipid reductase